MSSRAILRSDIPVDLSAYTWHRSSLYQRLLIKHVMIALWHLTSSFWDFLRPRRLTLRDSFFTSAQMCEWSASELNWRLCLLGSVSAEGSVWGRLKAGTYRGQNSIQLYMLFDTIWEWAQVEADIDRLEATTLQALRKPDAQYYAEMGGSAIRNLAKLWLSWRACAGGPNDDRKEDGVTRQVALLC